ncbi:protocatechuate 3,4-dioxygenase subunit alpha [Subtercola endophyticus]|uniref:protocatechuate 3,4-dioxygenase subunit alpha n=1 Tax=Subtercola endophyticus TaxID=2895559 RepID=UPI001E28C545|nr:protocatechuate 3,4-dioxygenase subunit alpha [Subtercola endophyticus]UFS58646.1 protocatechuate 3,4-dioxygenase subunit alpha [Subtercola endophyticus]
MSEQTADSTAVPETVAEPAPAEFVQTPSQTVGPFFGYALPYDGGGDIVNRVNPVAIRVHGRVFDGAGVGVPDALIELWQPDESGRISDELGSRERDGYTFTGFGRTPTTRAGDYTFTTVKPGAVAGADSGAPAYALVTVFARGLLYHLFTRVYFIDEEALSDQAAFDALVEADPLLKSVDPGRRATLIAVADGADSYRFDIHLQGESETVFLDFD